VDGGIRAAVKKYFKKWLTIVLNYDILGSKFVTKARRRKW
jgi:hypothetical protein